jgi:hypothetical protein
VTPKSNSPHPSSSTLNGAFLITVCYLCFRIEGELPRVGFSNVGCSL